MPKRTSKPPGLSTSEKGRALGPTVEEAWAVLAPELASTQEHARALALAVLDEAENATGHHSDAPGHGHCWSCDELKATRARINALP